MRVDAALIEYKTLGECPSHIMIKNKTKVCIHPLISWGRGPPPPRKRRKLGKFAYELCVRTIIRKKDGVVIAKPFTRMMDSKDRSLIDETYLSVL